MRTPTLIAPLALLIACGSPPTPREIMERAATQSCEQAFMCRDSFPDVGVSFEQVYGASVEACIARLSDAFATDDIVAGIDDGRIIYRADDAEECLDFAADLTCAQLWSSDDPDEPAACDTAFEGTLAPGATCNHDLECAGEGASCDGVCTAN